MRADIVTDIIDSINLADIKTAFYNNYKCYLSHIIDPMAEDPILLNSEIYKQKFVHSGLSLPIFNGFFFEDKNQMDSVMEIDQAEVTKFSQPYQLWFHPKNDGKQLSAALKSSGFKYLGDEIGVAIEIATMNKQISYPKSLYVEAINTQERMQRWLEVAKLKFNYRGDSHTEYFEKFKDIDFKAKRYWIKYIGWLNGEPSVVGTLILGGGVAMVYDEELLTHLKRNRWGIDDGLVLKLMMDALNKGYKIGGVFSTVGELRKYFNLGFQETCRLPKFVAVPKRR